MVDGARRSVPVIRLAVKSSMSPAVQSHGCELANVVNRRTSDNLGSIVPHTGSLDFCCRSHPESMASNTAV